MRGDCCGCREGESRRSYPPFQPANHAFVGIVGFAGDHGIGLDLRKQEDRLLPDRAPGAAVNTETTAESEGGDAALETRSKDGRRDGANGRKWDGIGWTGEDRGSTTLQMMKARLQCIRLELNSLTGTCSGIESTECEHKSDTK